MALTPPSRDVLYDLRLRLSGRDLDICVFSEGGNAARFSDEAGAGTMKGSG